MSLTNLQNSPKSNESTPIGMDYKPFGGGLFSDMKKHGHSKRGGMTPEYSCWLQLRARCYNANHKMYSHYGGRGIKVCDRWLESFENFYADMGNRPSNKHSLDRTDNNIGYSPENCRWATMTEQMNNTRQNRIITIDGVSLNVTQWAKKVGLNNNTIFTRLRLGYSEYDSIMTPLDLIKSKNNNSKRKNRD